MTELLDEAVAAHGGLDRWNALGSVQATLSVTGAIWAAKGRPDVFANLSFSADLHEEHVVLAPVSAADRHTLFRNGTLSLIDGSGRVVDRRHNPESMYQGQPPDAPWSDLQAAYFATEALWTYLTVPFLYTYPGFQCEEIASREENGEVWRRLQVDFPNNIASHTRRQVSAFGPDGLLRRHEYTVDILGGATGVLYATELQNFQGITVPTRRRIYAYDENRNRIDQPLLVAVDILSLEFTANVL